MRIGFDAKRAFLNNTGLGNYSRDLIKSLSTNYPNNDYFLYTTKTAKNNLESKNIHMKLITAVIKPPQSKIDTLFKSYWRSKKIINDIVEDKIELYHGLSNEIPYGIEKTNVKCIVTIHDLIFLKHPEFFKYIDRKIYFRKVQYACKKSDKIITVSKQTKQDIINFLKIPKDKIEVVYQSCNEIFQKKILKEKKDKISKKYNLPNKFLLYVGSIEERKNLLTILKSLNKLDNQKLVVIGNGKQYKRICEEYIKKNNLTNKVTFLMNLDIYEISCIYQLAEMLIYPSISEGFGIPIIEALFSNIPVITTNGGCFKEAGGDHSIYINPLSVNEMISSILLIQKNKELRTRMKLEGMKHVKKFTTTNTSKQMIDVYNSF